MKYSTFHHLYSIAREFKSAEDMIAEVGYPEWADEYERLYGDSAVNKVVCDLTLLHKLSCLSVDQLRKEAGWTQMRMSQMIDTSRRTVETWAARGRAPQYFTVLFAYAVFMELTGYGQQDS